jgi:hypothetical protein
MLYSGMLRSLALVRTEVSEERIAYTVIPSSQILVTLMVEALRSSVTSVHIRATQPIIPEDGILHSRRCEKLKSYMALTD